MFEAVSDYFGNTNLNLIVLILCFCFAWGSHKINSLDIEIGELNRAKEGLMMHINRLETNLGKAEMRLFEIETTEYFKQQSIEREKQTNPKKE